MFTGVLLGWRLNKLNSSPWTLAKFIDKLLWGFVRWEGLNSNSFYYFFYF